MIFESLKKAFELLISFNGEIYQIIFLSLLISVLATLTAGLIGTFLGIYISIKEFKLKKISKNIIFTFMGIPPVVLGLIVLLVLVGPFKGADLLFTKTAMYIAQTLLVLPVITGNIIMSSEKTQKKILDNKKKLSNLSERKNSEMIEKLSNKIKELGGKPNLENKDQTMLIKNLNKQLDQISVGSILSDKSKNILKDEKINNINVRFQKVIDLPFKDLRKLIDEGKKELKSGIVVV